MLVMLVMLVIACDRCVLSCDACVWTCGVCVLTCDACVFWLVFAVIVMPVMLVYAVLPVFWLVFCAISQFCCDCVF